MLDNAQCFATPTIRGDEGFAVLAAVAVDLQLLDKNGLRIELQQSARLRFILPDAAQGSKSEQTDYEAARDVFVRAFEETVPAVSFSLVRGAQSFRLDRFPPLLCTLFRMLVTLRGADAAAAQPLNDERLLLIPDALSDAAIESAGETVRRCPSTRLGISDGAGPPITVLHLRDNVDLGSMFAGHEGSGALDDNPALVAFAAGKYRVFLPIGCRPTRNVLNDLAKILRLNPHWILAGEGGGESAFAARFAGKGDGGTFEFFRLTLPSLPAPPEFETEEAGKVYEFAWYDLVQSENALDNLRDRVADLRPTAGYRLSLSPLSKTQRSDTDIDLLQQRVTELQMRIALAKGIQAPQFRLLRFSNAQLPALADGLTRFPAKAIDMGAIQYGWQPTAAEPAGLHFLMFRMDKAMMELPLPEQFWRGRTEDSPICYWLDPHWADRYAARRNVGSRVFVPVGTMLVPTLHSFGEADMDNQLQEIFKRMFPNLDQQLPNGADDRIYMFSNSENPDFEISIEILPGSGFAPIKERLGWINDNLELIDPAVIEPEKIKVLAESLFGGQEVLAVIDRAKAARDALDAKANSYEKGLVGRIGNTLKRAVNEINAMETRAQAVEQFLMKLSDRTAVLEQVMDQGYQLLEKGESKTDALTGEAADLQRLREVFEDRLVELLTNTDKQIVAAEKRLTETRSRLTQLMRDLEGLR